MDYKEGVQSYVDWLSDRVKDFTVDWVGKHTKEWIEYGILPEPTLEDYRKWEDENSRYKSN